MVQSLEELMRQTALKTRETSIEELVGKSGALMTPGERAAASGIPAPSADSLIGDSATRQERVKLGAMDENQAKAEARAILAKEEQAKAGKQRIMDAILQMGKQGLRRAGRPQRSQRGPHHKRAREKPGQKLLEEVMKSIVVPKGGAEVGTKTVGSVEELRGDPGEDKAFHEIQSSLPDGAIRVVDQMPRAFVEAYGIPGNAVILEPHKLSKGAQHQIRRLQAMGNRERGEVAFEQR